MRYVVALHEYSRDGLTRFAPGCLDEQVGKTIRVVDDFGDSKVGTLIRYEIDRNGSELRVELDLPGDLAGNPPLHALDAYSIAHTRAHQIHEHRRTKRFTGQRNW